MGSLSTSLPFAAIAKALLNDWSCPVRHRQLVMKTLVPSLLACGIDSVPGQGYHGLMGMIEIAVS
ncbi:MAG: hypothetical protein JSU73_03790 [candidate division WOR-3 bacterium]|nr:MAG: hypothetical protein JSU73_03790 [candidate division WOR-3 bacterium]